MPEQVSGKVGALLLSKVDDPHIRRVLEREAWESAIHAINLDLTVQQEEYQGAELEDWSKDK